MERLKVRAYIVSALLLATAAWSQLSPRPGKVAGRTEAWMEQVAPATVGNFSYIPNPNPRDNDTLCTYKDPKEVYDALAPTVGILARVYEFGGQKYDVNLIVSRDRASFHDPRVCFTAQHYDPVDGPQITIPTRRGDIPATLVQLTTPEGQPSVAVYFYRGPRGYYGSTTRFKMALLMDQLMGRVDLDGIFYRFIPEGDLDQKHLKEFISKYMDTAGEDSNGYF